MNAICCIARVPDTATRIKIAGDGKSIDPEGVQYVINPYDEFALEAAIQFKEKHGGELLVIHVGNAEFTKELRQCLAKGADRALQLEVNGPLGPQAISAILAKRIRDLMPATVFCGKQSVDGDVGATGTMLAMPATVRTCETGLAPLRLLNRSTGHPRFAATAAILPAGLVGRGLPTRYIRATSSSPSA